MAAQFICIPDDIPDRTLLMLTRLEERNIQVSIASKLKRKSQLLASRTNKLKRFGDQVPDLLASISEAYTTGRFLKRPVGPIGDFLFLCFCIAGLTSFWRYSRRHKVVKRKYFHILGNARICFLAES